MNVEQAVVALRDLIAAHGEEKHKDALKIMTQEVDVLRADKRRLSNAVRSLQGE